MKKKNKVLLITTCFFLLLSLLLGFLFWLTPSSSKPETPEQITKDILNDILRNETDVNLVSDLGIRIPNLVGGEISQQIMKNISYKIISIESQPNSSIATVLFTYPDIVTMADAYTKMSPEEVGEFFDWLKIALDKVHPTLQQELSLQLIKEDDVFYLVVTNDLYDVLSGGAVNYMIAAEKGAYEEWIN